MSVRSIARIAAVIFAAAVLVTLVYAAQRQARPSEVPVATPAAVQPDQLLPSTKDDGGGSLGRIQEEELLPSTKAGPFEPELLLPSTKAALPPPTERALLPATKAGPLPSELLRELQQQQAPNAPLQAPDAAAAQKKTP